MLLVFALLSVMLYAAGRYFFPAPESRGLKPFTKGYSVTRLSMDMTDENGHIMTRVKAPSMVYYEDSRVTEIESPSITLLTDEGGRWLFTSPQGEYRDDEDVLYFSGAVEALQKDANDQTLVRINTRRLRVDPRSKTAITDAPIKITQPRLLLTGTGAELDFNREEFEVKSNVHAEFNP